MSRRTQRTTKYLFGILAQWSKIFTFIYLGMNLFTQGAWVFKPIFIVVSDLAVLATRYAAVFPSRRRPTPPAAGMGRGTTSSHIRTR